MLIEILTGGYLCGNGYIIYDRAGGEAYVIDPGHNPGRFIVKLCSLKVKVKGILLTHHHRDHTDGAEAIRKATGCPVFMHEEDLDSYGDHVDLTLRHGQVLSLAEESILILHTPGHTRGSVCFYCATGKIAFTGDTIFNVDLGRTDLKDGSIDSMRLSVKDVIDRWEDDIIIYPGHGDPATMEHVRRKNKEFLSML